MVQRAGAGALGAVLAQHAMLFRGELALGRCVCHGVFLSFPNTSASGKWLRRRFGLATTIQHVAELAGIAEGKPAS